MGMSDMSTMTARVGVQLVCQAVTSLSSSTPPVTRMHTLLTSPPRTLTVAVVLSIRLVASLE